MRWRFEHDTIEDSTGTLHRPGCQKIENVADEHPAGSSVERRAAPRECSSRRPEVRMVL